MDISLPPTRQVEDLTQDKLLATAPRVTIDTFNRDVPALGAIPLLAKLGQGGMGAVYYGIHPRLDIEVAVKVLPFTLVDKDPNIVERFLREARIAAKIRSPHLVSVLDVHEDAGLHYIVMEYVVGCTAGECARRHQKQHGLGLPEADALEIIIAATRGLALAHEQSVIHRDIKPDNVLVPQGAKDSQPRLAEAKLADLGLARSESSSGTLTMANAIMGTPGFMAPEQGMDTHTAGKPADIFSMGATLYALLTGKAPFSGTSAMRIIMDTAQKPHAPITDYRDDLSVPTIEIIDRCLSKEPEKRHNDAGELLEDLLLAQKYIQAAKKLSAEPPPTLQEPDVEALPHDTPRAHPDDWVMPDKTPTAIRKFESQENQQGTPERVIDLDSSHLIDEAQIKPKKKRKRKNKKRKIEASPLSEQPGHKEQKVERIDTPKKPRDKLRKPGAQNSSRERYHWRRHTDKDSQHSSRNSNKGFITFVLLVSAGGICIAFWREESIQALKTAYTYFVSLLN